MRGAWGSIENLGKHGWWGNKEIFGGWGSWVKYGGSGEMCWGVGEVREDVLGVWGMGSRCVEVCLGCGERCGRRNMGQSGGASKCGKKSGVTI